MSVRAIKDGAVEFLTKPFRDQDLLDDIHQALDSDRVAREQRARAIELHHRYELLTPREREVMHWVVRGRPNKQSASKLGTSELTIKMHRGQVMHKMKLNRSWNCSGWPKRSRQAANPIPKCSRRHLP